MSEHRQDIKDAFAKIQELSNKEGIYHSLENYIVEILASLQKMADEDTDKEEIKEIQSARTALTSTSNSDDVKMVEIAEEEASHEDKSFNIYPTSLIFENR